MQLRYQFRLYPTPGQQVALAKAFGCARVVYNDGIRAREQARRAGLPYIRDTELQTRLTVVAKQTPERAWLADVSADVLIQSIRDMHTAYRNFFSSLSGKRKGPKLGPPKLKSKHRGQAIRFTRNGFRLRGNGRLFLAKVGEMRVVWSRELPAAPSSVTAIKDRAGRYFASFVVEIDTKPLPEAKAEVGIDLGLNAYAVDSHGRRIDNPRFLRNHERRLRRAHKALSRKAKGSANRAKARLRVALAHARVADSRRDWLHQTTTRLIRENQAIYLEDLAVSGLARTWLAKSVHDASWGTFRRMLAEKAARHGRLVAVIGRFEPTTKRCSACGAVKGKVPLAQRTYQCDHCGLVLDRDHNAALNILAAGQAERLNACGGDIRPRFVGAVAGETGTHP
ncbi:MAG TPA: transposase [Candidatus Limnocylindrales bacterium]